ncbi:MAG: hypothetical protein ACXWX0_05295 [Actinomycetota bacterium]
MIAAWLVRLVLARDDGGAVTDQQVAELIDDLTANGMSPVLGHKDPASIRVQVTVQATSDRAALAAAERSVRERAYEVWAAHGLPPFTISLDEVVLAG